MKANPKVILNLCFIIFPPILKFYLILLLCGPQALFIVNFQKLLMKMKNLHGENTLCEGL
jgi:hypothetical protein